MTNQIILDEGSKPQLNRLFVLADLTPTQIRYMQDYVIGKTMSEIAAKNGVSLSTVSHTVKTAKAKINRVWGMWAESLEV